MSDNDALPTYEETMALDRDVRPLDLSTDWNRESMKTQSVSPDKCIAHLKLLASIADLRDQISQSDSLFGLRDEFIDRFEPGEIKSSAGARIREKRWAVYVTRAVDRFEAWWDYCIPTGSPNAAFTLDDIGDAQTPRYAEAPAAAEPIPFTVDDIPPLDVIMVWHAYMLNPRIFLDDCLRGNKMSLWATGMPWEAINQVIDEDTFIFKPTGHMIENFQLKTGRPWDNLHEPPGKELVCPKCFNVLHADWTSPIPNIGDLSQFEQGVGYADQDFKTSCPHCNFSITHEALRVSKVRRDLNSLLQDQSPMPGTLLSENGIPEIVSGKKNVLLPNRIMMLPTIRDRVLRIVDPAITPSTSIADIRSFFSEEFEKQYGDIQRAGYHAPRRPEEKLSFRRMMARYWTNSSPHGLDLVGAVIRQGTFITKMVSINWIRSPTLNSTMHRLLEKYRIFVRIIAENETMTAVPTLDVDLAWHTHQLSPKHYFFYTTTQTNGRFINHDDRIEETKLSQAFEMTSRRYQVLTNGKPYSECVCWYCEAIREANNTHHIFSSFSRSNSRENANRLRDDPNLSPDPAQCAHISAHNARRSRDKADIHRAENMPWRLRNKYISVLEKNDKRSQQKSFKAGRGCHNLTDRLNQNLEYWSVVWGYPMYTSLYTPYAADPSITPELYATSPACLSTEQEAVGSCIAGTWVSDLSEVICGSAGGCGSGGCSSGGCGGGGGD